MDNVNLFVAYIKITVKVFRSSLKNHNFGFFYIFMFNIHDLQYWAKALRQTVCSPAFDRDNIIKSPAYKRELNLVPLNKTKGCYKMFSKE